MSIFKQKAAAGGTGEAYPIPDAEPHPGVLVAILDLGNHEEQYGDQEAKKARKVFLVWELTATPMPGGKQNFFVGRDFTLSLNEKANLRKFIRGWRGEDIPDGTDFDIGSLLGTPDGQGKPPGKKCIVNITHKKSADGKKTYSLVDSVSKIGRTTAPVPDPTVEPFLWEIDGGSELPEHEWLPHLYGKPVQEKIRVSQEWLAREQATGGRKPAGNGKASPHGAGGQKAMEAEADAAFSGKAKEEDDDIAF